MNGGSAFSMLIRNILGFRDMGEGRRRRGIRDSELWNFGIWGDYQISGYRDRSIAISKDSRIWEDFWDLRDSRFREFGDLGGLGSWRLPGIPGFSGISAYQGIGMVEVGDFGFGSFRDLGIFGYGDRGAGRISRVVGFGDVGIFGDFFDYQDFGVWENSVFEELRSLGESSEFRGFQLFPPSPANKLPDTCGHGRFFVGKCSHL